MRGLLRTAEKNPDRAIRSIYLSVLSRFPTPEELAAVKDYAQSGGATPEAGRLGPGVGAGKFQGIPVPALSRKPIWRWRNVLPFHAYE